jgi:hypothetical protein
MLERILQSIEEHLFQYCYAIIAFVVLATVVPCAIAVALTNKEKEE